MAGTILTRLKTFMPYEFRCFLKSFLCKLRSDRSYFWLIEEMFSKRAVPKDFFKGFSAVLSALFGKRRSIKYKQDSYNGHVARG